MRSCRCRGHHHMPFYAPALQQSAAGAWLLETHEGAHGRWGRALGNGRNLKCGTGCCEEILCTLPAYIYCGIRARLCVYAVPPLFSVAVKPSIPLLNLPTHPCELTPKLRNPRQSSQCIQNNWWMSLVLLAMITEASQRCEQVHLQCEHFITQHEFHIICLACPSARGKGERSD